MSKLFSKRRDSSNKSSIKSDKTKKSNTNLKQSFLNRTSHWNFAKITRYIVAFGVIVALVTSYFWYGQVYMTPERRFWIALNNSMATPSVVRTLKQGGSGNQVIQDYRFNFAPQRAVQNKVVYTEKSATTDTSVTTEGVIYPSDQFLRYTQFTNSRSDGQDNANIDEILGQWAYDDTVSAEDAKLNYLSEQVSLVIFGNYGANYRNSVINDMKNNQVYGDGLSLALEDSIDGNPVYVYTISVKLKEYARLLNSAFVEAGYGEFAPLNPDNYTEDATVNGTVAISKKNNSVVGVNFGGREEYYGNYGVTQEVEKPQADITIQELQTQVQELLQSAL